MPCDQVIYMSCSLECANKQLLVAGLERAGFRVYEQSWNGSLVVNRDDMQYSATISGTDVNLSQEDQQAGFVEVFKQAYSAESVRVAAEQKGWVVTRKNANLFQKQQQSQIKF